MQSIITKFIPPTNYLGSRYKASCQAGSITVSADHSLSAERNHLAACAALKLKLAQRNGKTYKPEHGWTLAGDPWMHPTVSGQNADGSYSHVFLPRELRVAIEQSSHAFCELSAGKRGGETMGACSQAAEALRDAMEGIRHV
jgi:hypothetical protein